MSRSHSRRDASSASSGSRELAAAVPGFLPQATTVEAGKILFEGEDLLQLDERELAARVRGGRIGFIPQDAYLALNPVFTIGSQLLAVMRRHAPAPAGR